MTCSPWQPTRVKKADRKALRVRPGARARSRSANSLHLEHEEGERRARRSRHATWIQTCAARAPPRQLARPQVKLDSSRQRGLDGDVAQVEQLRAAGPPAVASAQHRVGGEEAPRTSRCR